MQHIVIADDSRTVRSQLRRALTDAGFTVSEAGNGVEAIQRICSDQPFLTIVDINMPELDGYGVCQKLRELGTPWDKLPIIFLTSVQSHALEVLGNEMGAYLQKPVDPEAVVETVRSFLPLSA